MDLDGRGHGEELGGAQRGETISCEKKNLFSINGGKGISLLYAISQY